MPWARSAELRRRELVLRFATNTTSRPRRQIHARLRRLGFDVELDEIVTPAALAVRHCEERGHRGVALLMGDAVKEDFAGLREDGRIDAVIVGDLGDAFGHRVLNRAFRQVMDGAELIALQKNRYWLAPSGLSLDVGPYVAALEYAASVEALVVGKPAHAFFASALDGMRVPPERAAMVGDDVESDIGGAWRRGWPGSSSGRGNTARTRFSRAAWSRRRSSTRSRTCRDCSAAVDRAPARS